MSPENRMSRPAGPGTGVFARRESRVRSYCRDVPVVFHRAAGPHLWDTAGRRYVDLLCGAGALNYGHNPAPVVAAVQEYLAAGGPVQSLDLHTSAKAAFLERFAEQVLVPRGLGEYKVQFPGPAGTLAVEAALKLARKVTGRRSVVAFTGGFHGASLGALAATSSPLLRGGAGAGLPDVRVLPYDGFPGVADPEVLLEALLDPRAGAEPPAAILLETVQGEGGLTAASPRWLAQVRRLATACGALLVVDDVQAGCGRTGPFLSFERLGVTPDLVCLSKSLSGMGLPLAVVLIREDLDVWRPGEHNGTFRGHNLAFVAATAALEHYWADPGFGARVDRLADAIRTDLAGIADAVTEATGEPGSVAVAGRGAMSGLRYADAGAAEAARAGLLEAGVVAETSGAGRVLKFFPPITLPVAAWRGVAATLGDVLLTTARRPAAPLAA
jgi:diaminobutyrate-2-oxoglutarate transaminase